VACILKPVALAAGGYTFGKENGAGMRRRSLTVRASLQIHHHPEAEAPDCTPGQPKLSSALITRPFSQNRVIKITH